MKTAVRKTVKWGGAGLTVLLLVVWIGSCWFSTIWFAHYRGVVMVFGGQVVLQPPLSLDDFGGVGHFLFGQRRAEPRWWFEHRVTARGDWFTVPLWFPALLSLLATAAAWRADAKYMRRVRVGLCAGCGYDRAGLAAGVVCPECGKQAEAR